jgi:hypothetical protein
MMAARGDLFIAVAGAGLYILIATMTDRTEGWIFWAGAGLLLVSVGMIRLLLRRLRILISQISQERPRITNALASTASVVIVATIYWLLSLIVSRADYDYFLGWAVFLFCISPIVLVLSLVLSDGRTGT